MKSNFSQEDIRNKLKSLRNKNFDPKLIERESAILQASYLSEIEKLYQNIGLNRKDLATQIGTSPSYLTQVFRGDKPLNFLTLAKIKKALGLRFDLKASFASEKRTAFQVEIALVKPMASIVNIEFKKPANMKVIKGDIINQTDPDYKKLA